MKQKFRRCEPRHLSCRALIIELTRNARGKTYEIFEKGAQTLTECRSIAYRPAWRSFYKYWLFCWLIFPVFVIVWKRYSSALIVTPDTLICKKGIFNVKSTEVALEYIQSVEIKQSIAERLLMVGTIFAGTAATQGYEIKFRGAPCPHRITERIRLFSRMQREKEM